MLGGGFQGFVAWRYLMERRAPLHPFLVYLIVGIAVVSAFGFGLAEGLALGGLEWQPDPNVPHQMVLGFRAGVRASYGLAHVAAVLLAIAGIWRTGRVPWRTMAVAVVVGLGLGALAPWSMEIAGMALPRLVLIAGSAFAFLLLLLYALLGSRPIAALILGFATAGLVCTAVGFGLESYFRDHQRGQPYNNLVKSMSNLHVYDDRGRQILIGVGVAVLLIGALLRFIGRRRRGNVRGVLGWASLMTGVLLAGFGGALMQMPAEQTVAEWAKWWGLICIAPLVLLIPLGVFRYFFTFFTTVSMSGVFVGSMALVVVLSVMGGFETDLRDKILGSNAHIRVTRQEGMMSDWRDVMERIRRVSKVKGVTPYATTEVVLSANSNYATVVIKGIDIDTNASVTELFKDIEGEPEEQEDAVKRLYPLEEDPLNEEIIVDEDEPGDVTLDKAPDDMSGGGDPIDFSGDGDPEEPDEEDDEDEEEPEEDEEDEGALDPAPTDFTSGDLEEPAPRDFSDAAPEGAIELKDLIDGDEPGEDDVLDLPHDGGRLALLDGVLVGKELVKQLHLFTGQEVRLVSPLADPANPDATGTPIPFHRDYRIAGIFYTGMYEYDLKFVYVPIESLQDFIQIGDDIDGIEVRIDDPDDTGRVRDAIARELGPDYKVQDWKELNRNLFSALKLEKIAMFLVLAIIILVASFSIVGNLIMVVVEKGKEIALLKTLGASDIGVMGVFVMQGFFIGLVGTVAGVIEGLLICLMCKVFGFPINPDVYYIRTLPINVEWFSVGAIALAGLMISALATMYPAFMAARLRPAEGLRHD